MTCPSKEQLSQWIDGSLYDSDNAELKQHLSTCSICRDEVNELVWLDRLGREAVREIQVDPHHHSLGDCSTLKPRHPIHTLAKVAAVLLLLSFLFWELNHKRETTNMEVSQIEPKPRPLDKESHEAAVTRMDIDGKSDDAFERWIKPYRQLRIPLIPLEDLAPLSSVSPLTPSGTSSDDDA